MYSSDFPWRVDLQRSFPDHKFQSRSTRWLRSRARRICCRFLISNNPAIVLPDVNWYVPGPIGVNDGQMHAIGERAVAWFSFALLMGPERQRTTDAETGQRYLLVDDAGRHTGARQHGRRGTCVSSPVRAAIADGTQARRHDLLHVEQGHPQLPRAIKCFERWRLKSTRSASEPRFSKETFRTAPKMSTGLMVGASDLQFDEVRTSRFCPGAICEHLTSAGGILTKGDSKRRSPNSCATAPPAPAARVASPARSRPSFRCLRCNCITPAAVRWPKRFINRSADRIKYSLWATRCASRGRRLRKSWCKELKPTEV